MARACKILREPQDYYMMSEVLNEEETAVILSLTPVFETDSRGKGSMWSSKQRRTKPLLQLRQRPLGRDLYRSEEERPRWNPLAQVCQGTVERLERSEVKQLVLGKVQVIWMLSTDSTSEPRSSVRSLSKNSS
ncbi:uncharacterized protein LOC144259920 [Eretmochelys imbricata]